MPKRVNAEFYLNEDVVYLSRALLGKTLVTAFGKGNIAETEAYRGPDDRASHAYNNRRTKRTEVMFHKGGICYVYLCYGMYPLLNIVTNEEDIPHAILIRGIYMNGQFIWGPGRVARALGVDMSFNGACLQGERIWIEESTLTLPHTIEAHPRIGIDYAGVDALLPWRFRIHENKN